MPASSASPTSCDFWCRCSAQPVMKREQSSRNAHRYTRSCRRKRKVKISDCQSWFGSARSKRRGPASSLRAPACGSSSPASCSMRLTSLSLIPIAWNRFSTSRIRRVPYSGCAFLSASTASWRGSSFFACFVFPGLRPNNASAPPSAYFRCHCTSVVCASPKARQTSPTAVPAFSSCSTCNFSCGECVLRLVPCRDDAFRLPLFAFMSSPPASPARWIGEDGVKWFRPQSAEHQLARTTPLMQPYGQTLFTSFRCSRPPLRPAFRRTCVRRTARTGPREAQRGCQESRQPQTGHELSLPRLQEPLEGAAVPVPLRGAPQAAEEEAG